jgi:DNA-binding FadR family transcriptional regulator
VEVIPSAEDRAVRKSRAGGGVSSEPREAIGDRPARRQLRQPRLSEMVAEELRRRILSLELEDGAMLPRQEDLLAEFGVSVPSLREAMRILETEGFITVLRGSIGGAVVHVPQARDAAYNFGLILESSGTGLDDVMTALQWLEPVCAASCARRRDRRSAVLPSLRAIIKTSERVIADADAYGLEARRFHDQVVALCGNDTMILIIGALESLWSAQVHGLRQGNEAPGIIPELTMRKVTLDEHRHLVDAISAGDALLAESVARQHFSHLRRQAIYAGQDIPVRAALLRDV